jgi:DNA-binding MarR family transcriptional regulator
MAHTVTELEGDGLIARHPDPADGRRTLVELTPHGLEVLEEDRRNREGWLAQAIAEELSAEEQQVLTEALPLLRRISES